MISTLAIALLLVGAAFGDGDARDSILLKGKSKSIQGRIIQVHDPEVILIREPGKRKPKTIKRSKIESVGPILRTRIANWLDSRAPSDSVGDRWGHLEAARDAELTALARLQAYEILTLDSGHVNAHEFLGHKLKGKRWVWSTDTTGELAREGKSGKPISAVDFHKRIGERPNGLILESENYRLETNTSLEQAVAMLFDLERTYCTWLGEFGSQLIASELTWDPAHRMVVRIYRGPKEGFKENRSTDRYPYYSPSRAQTIADSPNVFFSFYSDYSATTIAGRPVQFFDLAIQQLIFTTLALGHSKSNPPRLDENSWAHWVQLGLGWWMEQRLQGEPGYAEYVPLDNLKQFRLPRAMAARAIRTPRNTPLGKIEIVNLIGMEWLTFYLLGDSGQSHRDKARSLVAYIMSQAPIANDKRDRPSSVKAIDGLLCYVRSTFRETKAHSSSEFDACFGGSAESLEAGWKQWVRSML